MLELIMTCLCSLGFIMFAVAYIVIITRDFSGWDMAPVSGIRYRRDNKEDG